MEFKNIFKNSMEHVKTGFDSVRTAVEKATKTVQQTITGISVVYVDFNLLNIYDSAICTKSFRVNGFNFVRGTRCAVYSFDDRYYIEVGQLDYPVTFRFTKQAFEAHFVIVPDIVDPSSMFEENGGETNEE